MLGCRFQDHCRAGVHDGAACRVVDVQRLALILGRIGVVVHAGHKDAHFAGGDSFQCSLVCAGDRHTVVGHSLKIIPAILDHIAATKSLQAPDFSGSGWPG